uniref:Uncharacterized protein n=1 Tax=Oryza sativa subsp. japonica TaxID=39947 RepID=Q5VPM8_ORYSJ|nr:hypothetical protein [Oryza sativa Japonica Group]
MEQKPIDNSSVTCETISVTPMPKTEIVSNPLPIAPIDFDNKKRFGQTPKQSEPSTISTPYRPPVVTPCQDRFLQKNRSGGSKVKNVKKVWVRKEAKTLEVITIKEEFQDVQVPLGDATKIIHVDKTKADVVTVNIGGLTKASGRSNRQPTAGLTEPSDRSTENIENHHLALETQPQLKWIPSGLSRSQQRKLQRLRAIGQKEKEAEDVKSKSHDDLDSNNT